MTQPKRDRKRRPGPETTILLATLALMATIAVAAVVIAVVGAR